MVAGDFNHDGNADLADSSNQMALGNGDGTFQPPVSIIPKPTGPGYNWIVAGDINNDGWTDLVLTDWQYDQIYVLVNNQQVDSSKTSLRIQAGPTAWRWLTSISMAISIWQYR
jgi:hypothetical protein